MWNWKEGKIFIITMLSIAAITIGYNKILETFNPHEIIGYSGFSLAIIIIAILIRKLVK